MFSDTDIARFRQQFPAVAKGDLIFFDNPGGTQVPGSVIEAVSNYYRTRCANVGGAFATSQRTDETIQQARTSVAALLGAPDPATIVFGPSMTALTFHIARSFAHTCSPGDEVIVTDLDHDGNVAPWLDLEASGVTVRRVPFDTATGTLNTAALLGLLQPGKTRLVAVGAASNALGTVTALKPIVQAAHEAGALVYIDAVQAVPHLPTDVVDLDCDFLACSSYKFFGPHAGIVYGKREHLERLTPHKVRPAKDTIPYRWELGTLNHEGLAGIHAAVEYLSGLTNTQGALRERLVAAMTAIQQYEQYLSTELLNGLDQISGVKVLGLTDIDRVSERVPTVAFTRDGESPRQICERLGAAGICSWSGNYYALGVMERYGLEATGGAVRIGLAHYNTVAEIHRFLEVLTG